MTGVSNMLNTNSDGYKDRLDADTTLHISVLGSKIDEQHLQEHFSQVGPVREIHLRYGKFNPLEKYGFVVFFKKEHAREALFRLNYSKLLGKECRLTPYNSDRLDRLKTTGNMLLENLASEVTEKDVYHLLVKYGNIKSVRVLSREGRSYINFERDEDAFSATQSISNMRLFGKEVTATYKGIKLDTSEIYIKDLDPDVSIKVLASVLSRFGDLKACRIHVDAEGNPVGTASAVYETRREARWAVSGMNGVTLGNRVIRATHAVGNQTYPTNDGWRDNTLYIKNVDPFVTDAQLRAVFLPFGQIAECKLAYGPNGASRGYGFITFKARSDAERAIAKMYGRLLGNKNIYPSFYKSTRLAHPAKPKPKPNLKPIPSEPPLYKSSPPSYNMTPPSPTPSVANFADNSAPTADLTRQAADTTDMTNMMNDMKIIACSLANILSNLPTGHSSK